jgi:hypothetical protein
MSGHQSPERDPGIGSMSRETFFVRPSLFFRLGCLVRLLVGSKLMTCECVRRSDEAAKETGELPLLFGAVLVC